MGKTAAERIRQALNSTGCYCLTGIKPADWEGDACAAGLEALEEDMAALLKDLFASTSSKQRLDSWEKFMRPQPSAGSLEDRRAILIQRLAINPSKFRPADLSPLLEAAGIRGTVLEQDDSLLILLGKFLGLSEEEVQRELALILPVSLPWEIDRSMNWVALEANQRTFQEWDELGLDWSALDAMTREQMEEKEENSGVN